MQVGKKRRKKLITCKNKQLKTVAIYILEQLYLFALCIVIHGQGVGNQKMAGFD